jgi:predicted nucleic acid-binding protein
VTHILVDTNVLVDIIRFDPIWTQWSSEALAHAHEAAVVVVNPVVYGELAAGFATIEALDDALPGDLYRREAVPFPAAFLAGRCFTDYRRRGGTRLGVLPDFFIGAHAAVAGYRLLTRDPRRYRTYFPTLDLITPVTPD